MLDTFQGIGQQASQTPYLEEARGSATILAFLFTYADAGAFKGTLGFAILGSESEESASHWEWFWLLVLLADQTKE